jgi:hypothetical protein
MGEADGQEIIANVEDAIRHELQRRIHALQAERDALRAEVAGLVAAVQRVKDEWPWGDEDREFDRLTRAVGDLIDVHAEVRSALAARPADGEASR